jgi:hypothetical protein
MAVLQRTPTRLADGLASADSASAGLADSPLRRTTRLIVPSAAHLVSPLPGRVKRPDIRHFQLCVKRTPGTR